MKFDCKFRTGNEIYERPYVLELYQTSAGICPISRTDTFLYKYSTPQRELNPAYGMDDDDVDDDDIWIIDRKMSPTSNAVKNTMHAVLRCATFSILL
ncbi:hypothetical protein ANN_23011 [Periplaneta americana]|uniref:Uncharacterized protein n=1 Tax=Periplaneta americana TaxID=6978 RepID=A0ABQ8SKR3_PERAM|nr:hypothetical protein ANN_23011 [Periplaneta americana]